MSRSLSWIEENAVNDQRLSQLTQPVGEAKSDLPSPELAPERPPAAATHGRPAVPPAISRRPAAPPARSSAPIQRAQPTQPSPAEPRKPPPSRVNRTSIAPAPARSSNRPVPYIPEDRDPWTQTPAQPWTAVASPADDQSTLGVPELNYPAAMALASRLELFRDWIQQHCGEGAFFVSDPDGLPLLLERIRTPQAVTAVALERAMHPLRGLFGSTRANSMCIELDDGRLVQTVWASTLYGRVAVGMAPERPLGPAATAQIRRALIGIFGDEELK